jgi:hypothetical protein
MPGTDTQPALGSHKPEQQSPPNWQLAPTALQFAVEPAKLGPPPAFVPPLALVPPTPAPLAVLPATAAPPALPDPLEPQPAHTELSASNVKTALRNAFIELSLVFMSVGWETGRVLCV